MFNEKPSLEEVGAVDGAAGGDDVAEVLPRGAVIHTTKGDITLKLFPDECPKTVENFTTHARNGYYEGIIFHRVIKGFMLQTGDPLGAPRYPPSAAHKQAPSPPLCVQPSATRWNLNQLDQLLLGSLLCWSASPVCAAAVWVMQSDGMQEWALLCVLVPAMQHVEGITSASCQHCHEFHWLTEASMHGAILWNWQAREDHWQRYVSSL